MSEIRVDTISEKTSANGVAVDGVTLKDGGIAATLASTITTADNTDTLTLKSTDADGNSGPILRLNRDSGSPADGDVIGEIHFNADDDAGNTTSFFSMSANIRDASNGDEDVQMVFNGFRGGNRVNYLEFDGDHVVFNEGSADIDFRVESNDRTSMLNVDAGLNKVGVGDVPDLGFLHVKVSDSGASVNTSHDTLVLEENGNSGISILSSTSNAGAICFGDSGNNCIAYLNYDHANNSMQFGANNAERMRILSSGELLIGKTVTTFTTSGITFGNTTGEIAAVTAASPPVFLNRQNDDGGLVVFYQANSQEGNISVSGSTVSYNGFTGSHWSRLADNSKPTILRGTIMDSIDEMCDWYQAVADVAEVKYTAEDQAVIDGDKNVGDVKIEAHKIIEEIALPSDKSVGDAVTFTSKGVEYTGKYVKEGDVKHVKSKVSNTADSTKIYGVFSHWDEEGAATINDMFVSQVGTYIIRVHQDVTVAAGDLLVSNGDGTAKVQDDDIIRSKTVAKVNSNIKVETYSDGSYTVPCTLHC